MNFYKAASLFVALMSRMSKIATGNIQSIGNVAQSLNDTPFSIAHENFMGSCVIDKVENDTACFYSTNIAEGYKENWNTTSIQEDESEDEVEALGFMGLVASLLYDIMSDDKKKKLEAFLKISNRKKEVSENLQFVLDRKYRSGQSRIYMLSSAITMNLEWLASLILKKTDSDTASGSVYMLARKYMADRSPELYKMTVEAIKKSRKKANMDFLMLFDDIKETGNVAEIDILQAVFNAVNQHNIHLFMNKNHVFVLEYLSKNTSLRNTVGNSIRNSTCGLILAIRKWYEPMLELFSVDTVESKIACLMEREKGPYLVPAVDFVLRTEGEHEMMKKKLYHDHINFIALVNYYRKNEIRDFLDRNKEYAYDTNILRWVVSRRKWDALDAIIETIENTGEKAQAEISEDVFLGLVTSNKIDKLFGVIRCGYRINTASKELLSAVKKDVRLKYIADPMGLRMYNVEMIDGMFKVKEWDTVERIRERLSDKQELDTYIASMEKYIIDSYANHVCGVGDLDRLEYLVSKNATIGVNGANSACMNGHNGVLKYLVGKNIKPCVRGANYACKNGHMDIVEYLFEIGVEPDTNGANYACKNGYKNIVEYLFERQVEPNELGIEYAYEEGHTDIVKYLFSQSITPMDMDDMIGNVCYNGYIDMLKYLLEEEGLKAKEEASDYACYSGHKNIVEYLFSKGINASTSGINLACLNGHIDIVKYLFSKGIKANDHGANNACSNGHIKIIEYLFSEGVNASIVGMNHACKKGYTDIVKYLTLRGIEHDTGSVDIACENGNLEIVQYFVESGIKASKNGSNKAYKNGHLEIVKYLASKGVMADEYRYYACNTMN